jgi:hypothetical protein
MHGYVPLSYFAWGGFWPGPIQDPGAVNDSDECNRGAACVPDRYLLMAELLLYTDAAIHRCGVLLGTR